MGKFWLYLCIICKCCKWFVIYVVLCFWDFVGFYYFMLFFCFDVFLMEVIKCLFKMYDIDENIMVICVFEDWLSEDI